MTGRVRRRIQAKLDLINHAMYLVTESSPETAERFVDEAEASFAQLVGQPQMGWQRTFWNRRLSGIRVWRVKGFPDYLIFYLPLDDGADIIRVLHASATWKISWRMSLSKDWRTSRMENPGNRDADYQGHSSRQLPVQAETITGKAQWHANQAQQSHTTSYASKSVTHEYPPALAC